MFFEDNFNHTYLFPFYVGNSNAILPPIGTTSQGQWYEPKSMVAGSKHVVPKMDTVPDAAAGQSLSRLRQLMSEVKDQSLS